MKYQKISYKYKLVKNEYFKIPITGIEIDMEYAYLGLIGDLIVFTDYQWDGASGPTIDDKTNMRGSLVHDVLYQFLREKKLDAKYRKIADKILFGVLREDRMPYFRAKYYYYGVRIGGGPFADPKGPFADPKIEKKVYEAP